MTVAAQVAELGRVARLTGVACYVDRLRDDERFAAEMAYCAPRGIPHSLFVAWNPDDQDKALAWQVEQALKCPHCGTRSDEWIDPATGVTVPEPPYVAEARQCWGCAEKEAVSRDLRKRGDADGLYVSLRPYDPDVDDEDG